MCDRTKMKRIRNTNEKNTQFYLWKTNTRYVARLWYKMAETLTIIYNTQLSLKLASQLSFLQLFFGWFLFRCIVAYFCYEFPFSASNNCYQSNRSLAFLSFLRFCTDSFIHLFIFLVFWIPFRSVSMPIVSGGLLFWI